MLAVQGRHWKEPLRLAGRGVTGVPDGGGWEWLKNHTEHHEPDELQPNIQCDYGVLKEIFLLDYTTIIFIRRYNTMKVVIHFTT